MTSDHDRLRQRVLAWDELEGEERREADEHLASCAECRDRLAAFQRHESRPGPRGAMPETLLVAPPALDAREWPAAEASRLALHARLGNAPDRRPTRAAWSRSARWLVPLAAAAAITLVWFVRPRAPEVAAPEELAVVRLGVMRGDTSRGAPEDTLWRTGDAFALHARLARPGWPVVVHVGPDGDVELLRPDAGEPAPLAPGVHRLGPADPSREWALEDPPGREDLFVAISSRAAPDRVELERELRAIEGEREAKLRAVQRLLERRIGPVRSVVIAHR